MKKTAKYTDRGADLYKMLVEEPGQAYTPQGFDLIQLSRKGIIKKYLLELAKKLSFTMQELARVLHISERTLQRYRQEDVLAPGASERALLLTQLYRRGVGVLGSADNFKDWLRTPLPAFQQEAPITFLDTAFGFELIS